LSDGIEIEYLINYYHNREFLEIEIRLYKHIKIINLKNYIDNSLLNINERFGREELIQQLKDLKVILEEDVI